MFYTQYLSKPLGASMQNTSISQITILGPCTRHYEKEWVAMSQLTFDWPSWQKRGPGCVKVDTWNPSSSDRSSTLSILPSNLHMHSAGQVDLHYNERLPPPRLKRAAVVRVGFTERVLSPSKTATKAPKITPCIQNVNVDFEPDSSQPAGR